MIPSVPTRVNRSTSTATGAPRRRRAGQACILLCTMPAFLAAAVAALAGETGGYTIDWQTIDNGGSTIPAAGGGFDLSGTIGQPDAGPATGGGFELTGGFWFEHAPGDCNIDGGVTLQDYRRFPDCLNGPGDSTIPGECRCADFDGDADIDLNDAAEWQRSQSAQ